MRSFPPAWLLLASLFGAAACFADTLAFTQELVMFQRAGLTPMQALQTATLNPAKFMGRTADLGTVEKGKLADLVVLDADPLTDVANTEKIRAVVLAGRYFDRTALDPMLGDVEKAAAAEPVPAAKPGPTP